MTMQKAKFGQWTTDWHPCQRETNSHPLTTLTKKVFITKVFLQKLSISLGCRRKLENLGRTPAGAGGTPQHCTERLASKLNLKLSCCDAIVLITSCCDTGSKTNQKKPKQDIWFKCILVKLSLKFTLSSAAFQKYDAWCMMHYHVIKTKSHDVLDCGIPLLFHSNCPVLRSNWFGQYTGHCLSYTVPGEGACTTEKMCEWQCVPA